MNDNTDDNIISFPTNKRKDDVRRDRIEQQGFTIPSMNQFYDYDTIKFNFDGLDGGPVFIPMSQTTIDYTPVLNQPTKLESLMDQCNNLQKRIVFHTAKNNTVLLKMIEDKIKEALALANLNKDL